MTDSPPVVFLLGVPRSGTTLLSWLLNQHQHLYCPPEPWLLLGLDALGQVSLEHVADPPLLSGAITEFLGTERSQILKQAALTIYQQALRETGKSIFVDKTPRYYHILEVIKNFLPESKIIFLVRNPLDVAASFKTAWSADLPKIISTQKDTTFLFDYILGFSYLLDFEANHPVLRVHYEDLVNNAESQMERIFEYLALPSQTLEEDIAAHIQETPYAKSAFGDNNLLAEHSIHTRSIDSYKRVFTKEEITLLLNALGEENFSRLGYAQLYSSLCTEWGITPSAEVFPKLFEVAEQYAGQRKKSCANPGSRGIVEQQIGSLRQQLDTFQNHNARLNEQLSLAKAQNIILEGNLSLSQQQNEATRQENEGLKQQKEAQNQQLHALQNRGLRARLRADWDYTKIRLKQIILWGLWRLIQGPPPPPLPKITLVTPVFNGAQFIEATLRSVLAQRYPALEYIIVDGGSTDSTLEIIERIQDDAALPNKITRVISEPDRGMYDAVAKGFSQATGEIFAYLNSDDLLEGGALASVGSYFARHPKTAVIYHEDTVLVNGWKYPNVRQPKGINTADLLEKHILFQDGVFFRCSAYHAVGGFRRDLQLAGDYDLWLRLSAQFKFIRRSPHVSCFRVRLGQLSGAMDRYHQEADQARRDFLARSSPRQKLRWKMQGKYRFFRQFRGNLTANERLFFPLDLSKLPPPPATLSGTGYGQAVSPIDGKPAERLLFSTSGGCFANKTVTPVYLDTRHGIAVTNPPVQASELDRLYPQHYSALPPATNDLEGISPYREFNGKRLWEKALLRLPVERLVRFSPNGRLDNSLSELTCVLQTSKVATHSPLRVLIVGCFEGHLLDGIASQKPWRAYGLEPNPRAVEKARSQGHCVWQGHAEEAAEMIPASYQFEVIFMEQDIGYADNPVQILCRLRLLLAPGGVLVIGTPNLDSRQIDWFGPTWAHWNPTHRRYIFSRRGVFALARQAGLQAIYLRTFSRCDWTVKSITQNWHGLRGSMSLGADFIHHLRRRAQRMNFWQQLFWNRTGKGDYCFVVMGEGADD